MVEQVADGPVKSRASKGESARRGAPAMRRDMSEDFQAPPRRLGLTGGVASRAMVDEDEEYAPRRYSGVRFRLRGGMPRSAAGRVMVSGVMLAGIVGFTAALWEARTMLLGNPRLVLASSAGIEIKGNEHLTRAQLLGVFGGDVDRNVLTLPLEERKAELERLPWVEHATVMRLLPNRVRVAIEERTPVAFVRQGSIVGLVDKHGVLLDMAADGNTGAALHYSFPVITGVAQSDPLSVRAARMKVYLRFMQELDAGGKVSGNLSEVDLSNPEDVKALIPHESGGKTADVLVHFGEEDFRHRYDLYEKHLPEWLSAHPRLAAADMRYEHQVVLEMQAGAGASETTDNVAEAHATPKLHAAELASGGKTVAAAKNPTSQKRDVGHPDSVPKVHLQTAFDVKPKGAKTTTTQAGPQ